MAKRQVFSIAVLYLLSQLFQKSACLCTGGGSEESISGWKLQRHTYKTMKANLGHECVFVCRQDDICQSFNFVISIGVCEFNNRTKEARPKDFVADPDRYYYRRDLKRVPLGSIPELPAESCREIKASEGQVATGGKYWMSTIKPGMSVFAHCDMKTGVPRSCADNYNSGNKTSGVYKIDPDGLGEFEVFCDQTTAGGGWTVFQKRFDGSVDFYRGWDDYKRGFGNLTGEFWLGLDKIHRLTVSSNNSLRVDLEDLPGNSSFAEYSSFAVGNETEKYKLSVKGFSGTAGDALAYHRGSPFTTKDSDNDRWSSGNCALTKKGGWWYISCYESNLNGQYMPGAINRGPGMNWYYWKKSSYSAKRTEMKIRPKEF